MSDTPISDAAARRGAYYDDGDYSSTGGKQIVHISDARTLERENAAMREAIKEAHAALERVAKEAQSRGGFQCGSPEMVTMHLKAGAVEECRIASAKLQPFLKP